MALELNIQSRSKARHRTVSARRKTGQVFLTIVTIILVVLFGILYLSQANQVATKGFEIKELEKEIDIASELSKELQYEITELQSLRNLEQKIEELNFVPTSKIQYVAGVNTKKDVARSE